MTSFKTRLLETFKNLKSDAVPRAPRSEKSESSPTVEEVPEPDFTLPEDAEYSKKGNKQKKFAKSFFKPEGKKNKEKPDTEHSKNGKENVIINTQGITYLPITILQCPGTIHVKCM